MVTRVSLFILITAFWVGCHGSNPGEPPDGGSRWCKVAFDCEAGQICDSSSETCIAASPCTNSDHCGLGAFCDSNGQCQLNSVGAQCQTAAECGGSQCQFGYCGCDGAHYTPEAIEPNIMVLLDRSTSMLFNLYASKHPDGSWNYDAPIRWDSAQPAVSTISSLYESRAQLGLAVYPKTAGSRCETSVNPLVSPALLTSADIDSAMAANAPATDFKSTPIRETMENVASGALFQADPARDNYVLLVTDGEPNCARSGDSLAQNKDYITSIAADMSSRSVPVKTFAVGFGGDTDNGFLDAVAAAGGTGSAFSTADETSLLAALDAVLEQTVSCTFSLDPAIDPSQLAVHINGGLISQDANQGYTIDGDKLRLHGNSCDQMRMDNAEVTIVAGCNVAVD